VATSRPPQSCSARPRYRLSCVPEALAQASVGRVDALHAAHQLDHDAQQLSEYRLDRRTATGSTTSLASYANPPVSAAPARVVRSGRDTRYDRESTVWAPVSMFVSFTVGVL
jgi:hypothetical protein